MKKDSWVLVAAVVLVLGAAGYSVAQSTGTGPQGMMGSGMGMMGGNMTGQGGQGGMMGSGMMGMMGMMSMMSGQPLTPEQLDQFAKQHGITPEQAKQMTDTCAQIMARTDTPQTQAQ